MKNAVKKMLVLLMTLLLATFAFTACDSDDDDDDQPNYNRSFTVAVYDDEMNLIFKNEYSSQDYNEIDSSKLSQLQRVGYKFEGIYDISTDSMLFNAKGTQSPLVLIDKDYKAYVKYSPIAYQLMFESGDGKLESTSDYIKNISYGEVIPSFPEATLSGKEFDGWYDGSGNRYSFGTTPVYSKFVEGSYPIAEEPVKLYARYSDKYYNVSLIFQDGTSDVQLTVKHGDMLPDLTEYFKDNGSREVTGFGLSPSATDSVENQYIYTDLELYALWKDYKNVLFSYAKDDVRQIKIYRSGTSYTLPDGERDGYVFEGWYSNELLSGSKVTSVPFGSIATIYYAKWSVGTYTISFVADGRTVSSGTFSIESTDFTVPAVPEKEHYTGKWENYKLEYKDMTVNAIYEPEEFKLTLMSGSDYTYQTVKYGESFTLRIPKKKGYSFDGWYYGNEKVTGSDGVSVKLYTYDTAITLTPKWIITQCTLTFDTSGGEAIEAVKVDYGTPYTLTQIPEREGYYFGGWFDETLTNEYTSAISLTSDTTVYAKWIKSVAIDDADGLRAIADNPRGNYHLTANINLRGDVWEPLESFAGILNGNGYKIYNFSLKKDNGDLAFILNNTGTIKNLSLSNVELSGTVNTDVDASISVLCAYNEGNIINVNAESVNALVNVKTTNVNRSVYVGMLIGVNSGKIASSSAKSSMTWRENVYAEGSGANYTSKLYIGGICGKDTGSISDVSSVFEIDANELVRSYIYTYDSGAWARKYAYLYIGGVCGAEFGVIKGSVSEFTVDFYSNGQANVGRYGNAGTGRYTYIGGAVGATDESGSIFDCYSYGSAELARVGNGAENNEFYSGGIVGKAASGTVNNCASKMDLTLKEGQGGYMSGIAGQIGAGARVSNVAYYGEVKTESYAGGYFSGISGKVEGALTKAYFHGKITTESKNTADIASEIVSSGTVSKTIGNANTAKVFVKNDGSATNNYIIESGECDPDMIFDADELFGSLCLFEADIWAVDQDNGLYLISFPEFELPSLKI